MGYSQEWYNFSSLSASRKKIPFKQIELALEPEEKDEKNEIIDKLNKINPLEITPIEAINILYELKNDIKKK